MPGSPIDRLGVNIYVGLQRSTGSQKASGVEAVILNGSPPRRLHDASEIGGGPTQPEKVHHRQNIRNCERCNDHRDGHDCDQLDQTKPALLSPSHRRVSSSLYNGHDNHEFQLAESTLYSSS
jgi:hypothetical protein